MRELQRHELQGAGCWKRDDILKRRGGGEESGLDLVYSSRSSACDLRMPH